MFGINLTSGVVSSFMLTMGTLAVCMAFAQESSGGAAMAMANRAANAAIPSLKAGQAVSLTVNQASTDFTARLVKGEVLVPARLFLQTGQQVRWTMIGRRVVIRDAKNPQLTMDFNLDGGSKASLGALLEKGRLWVPVAPVAANFGHSLTWVSSSHRINLTTNIDQQRP